MFSILLILLLFTPSVLKTSLIINWIINNHFISSTLCEKRYDLENDCNGVCYISKQLNTVENQLQKQQPKEQSPTIVIADNTSPFIILEYIHVLKGFEILEDFMFEVESFHIPQSFVNDIFHPPQFV